MNDDMRTDHEIRFLGDLQRLRPAPGDVFVLMSDRFISREQVAFIRQQWDRAMPGVPIFVLDGGVKIGCISAPPEAPC